MVGWHHQLNGHKFEQTLGDSEGQGSLVSCSPRNSQESSPTPQFKSVSSLVLSLLYDPALISIHDYWKNHSFDSKLNYT